MFRCPPVLRAGLGAAVLLLGLGASALPAGAATAKAAKTTAPAHVGPEVVEHVLANGMRVLLVPRHLAPTIACCWIAHVGSVNERPGRNDVSR